MSRFLSVTNFHHTVAAVRLAANRRLDVLKDADLKKIKIIITYKSKLAIGPMRRQAIWNSLHPPTAVAYFCPLLSPPTHTIPHSQVKITPHPAPWMGCGGRGGSVFDVAEQLLLVHLEAALLPQVPQLLQRGAQLLA